MDKIRSLEKWGNQRNPAVETWQSKQIQLATNQASVAEAAMTQHAVRCFSHQINKNISTSTTFFPSEILLTHQSQSWSLIPRRVSEIVSCCQYRGTDGYTALYQTSDKTSFAYISARDRWPVILVSGCWICSFLYYCNDCCRLSWCGETLLSCMLSTVRGTGGESCDGLDLLRRP
jgi:hypothetical protein